MTDPRLASWRVLYQVLEEGKYSHLQLQQIFRENPDYTARDRAFAERIVRGVLEHLYELDAWIDHGSRLPVRKLKPQIRTLLRMSVYQILYMDSVPARAVCNEAVKLAVKLKFGSLKGYVNGVLRGLAREQEAGFSVYREQMSFKERAHLQYSVPMWMLERFSRELGELQTEKMLQAWMQPVKLSVYRNSMQLSAAALQKALTAAGAEPKVLPYGLDGFALADGVDLEHLPLFQQGAFLIQDVSSMVQGKVVSAQKEQYILDVCAAPGGKTFHAAMDMEGTGCVDAGDLSERKAALIRDNAKRLKLPNVRISVRDALVFDPSLEEKADVVIADLPCSGLGIIGRKPEIRYNLKEEDIRALALLQRQILDTVWRYVKPGGRLVYSTCTLSAEEDEENYHYLTGSLPFEPEPLGRYLSETYFADETDRESLKNGYIKLIPGKHPCDGFFVGSAVRKT